MMTNRSMMDLHSTLSIHRTMEVRREAYLDYMTFRRNDQTLFTEIFGPLLGLREEWAQQGATAGELDFSAFPYRRAMVGHVPVNTGWMGGPEPRILKETDDLITGTDRYGRRVQLAKHVATLPLPMDYPVATMADWRRIKANYANAESRFADGWQEQARQHREAGRVVTVSIPGAFDEPRQLMGEAALCEALIAEPELIADMLNTIGDTAQQVLDRVSAAVEIDQLFVHEDMAGAHGPMVGPTHIDAFFKPYYRRIWDMLASRGARLFDMDTDGYLHPILPNLIDAGINVIHPMESAAAMDIVSIRQQYGTRLAFVGGIDKFALGGSFEDIDRELEYKIPPMVRTGGCVLGLDHRIPNGTTLKNYRYYIRRAWEIIDREEKQRANIADTPPPVGPIIGAS